MNPEQFNDQLFSFLKSVPTPHHAVSVLENELMRHRFLKLDEGTSWNIEQGKRYFCVRNGALIALATGSSTELLSGLRMIGAHTDSPSLQIKPNRKSGGEPYLLCGVEKYGGAILSSWFDRELSLAGRVSYTRKDGSHTSRLINFNRPILYIPSLAIHLNRSVNEGFEVNPQTHLSPILAQSTGDRLPELASLLRQQLDAQYPGEHPLEINGFDLFCYDPSNPGYFGLNSEFIAAPRLDNLLSCFVGLKAITQSNDKTSSLLICSNHEEIGSRSNSGALGNFVQSVLSRLFNSSQEQSIAMHNSFLMSLDNAHASHPNYQDSYDKDHLVLLNGGPVIKINANQRYCTTGLSASVLRILASEASVKYQDFVMRSDMTCGSTIGPLTSAQLGVAAVDIGIPTLAMHSIREVTGKNDPYDLYRLTCTFVNRKSLPPFHD